MKLLIYSQTPSVEVWEWISNFMIAINFTLPEYWYACFAWMRLWRIENHRLKWKDSGVGNDFFTRHHSDAKWSLHYDDKNNNNIDNTDYDDKDNYDDDDMSFVGHCRYSTSDISQQHRTPNLILFTYTGILLLGQISNGKWLTFRTKEISP